MKYIKTYKIFESNKYKPISVDIEFDYNDLEEFLNEVKNIIKLIYYHI